MAEQALKPAEWENLFSWVQNLLGHPIPSYVKFPLGILVLLALIASVLVVIFVAVSKIKEIWLEKLLPHTYRAEQRQRAANRRTFASYLSREIVNRNIAERWRDEEFADLEAEVETEGDRRSLLPFLHRRGLRRERSLTRALERSAERLILVEGDPGSGKSVALRHVALRLSEAAARSRRSDSKLPILVNLKEIKRTNEPIDRSLIRKLVLETLNRVNDHFVDEFLDANFDDGVKNGLFVFVFDSFDEIPEILSSTQSDDIINNYSNAISDFLSGMNECRGIIASRSYKGPERQGWRTFRILELSSERQQTLIKRALALKPELGPALLGELALAQEDVRAMTRNPMLLGLLCEHMRLGNVFPSTPYEVFSRYVEHRFHRDAGRVRSRYSLDTHDLRDWAERIAFAMTSDAALGLSPRREDLRIALRREHPRLSLSRLDSTLDALEFIKFGRSDGSTDTGSARQFTFSHRRFQEYFTTRVAIAEPTRVKPRQLLTDARWRETAVVLLQTGAAGDTAALLSEADLLLDEGALTFDASQGVRWPPGILHVLEILQAGLGNRPEEIPQRIRVNSATILEAAFEHGNLLDKKYVIEVAGLLGEELLLPLLRTALKIDSQWLNDAVYLQIARLAKVPEDISLGMRNTILRWGLTGQLSRNWHGVRAHLLRLSGAAKFLLSARLSRWIYRIDQISLTGVVLVSFYCYFPKPLTIYHIICLLIATTLALAFVKIFWLTYLALDFPEGLATLFRACFTAGILVAIGFSIRNSILSIMTLHASRKDVFSVMALVICAYLSFWPIAAATCVQQGALLSRIKWPIFPAIYVRIAYRWSRRDWKKPIKLLIMSVCWGGFIGLIHFIPETIALWILVPLVVVGFVSIIAIGIMIIVLAIVHLAKFVGDYRRYKSYDLGKRGSLAGSTLRVRHGELKTGSWRLRLLREARLRNAIETNEASEREIRVMLRDLNGGLTRMGKARQVAAVFTRDRLPRTSERRDELYAILESLTRAQVKVPAQTNGLA